MFLIIFFDALAKKEGVGMNMPRFCRFAYVISRSADLLYMIPSIRRRVYTVLEKWTSARACFKYLHYFDFSLSRSLVTSITRYLDCSMQLFLHCFAQFTSSMLNSYFRDEQSLPISALSPCMWPMLHLQSVLVDMYFAHAPYHQHALANAHTRLTIARGGMELLRW